MTDLKLLTAILDSLTESVTFADNDHIVRYMNVRAIEQFAKRGGEKLVGTSLLDCHNEESKATIRAIHREMMTEGLEERMTSDTPERRLYMRAVRDAEGKLLGYFERYEFPKEW